MATIDTKRRVKHYVLNDARQWVDRGTGHVSWIYNDKQKSVSLIVKSENDGSTLLEAKILLSIVYQRQQDTLIVWSDTNRRDLALSFQEKAGCDEIWEKICEVLGEDSSQDITSSRERAGTNGDALDESDDDQLENDINTSPNSDLPQCELNKLKDIRDFFILELPRKSKIYKERLASVLETDSYIKKLIEIFHICEDLENTEGLNFLFEIFRSLFYLNKSSLLDILLSDDLIMDVIGCLEYDPNKNDHQRHREYITTKSKFKEIISFENSDLVNKIHQTYKVQYIQDVILPAPSVFEENSLTSLSSFIFLNKVEISNLIQEDDRFLNELFEHLKNLNLEIEKRSDMLQFLKEFTSFLHSLQQTREPFFKSLYDHGILDVIEIALGIKNEKINVLSIDILSQFVEVSPTLVREYILNEIESKSSVNNLSASFKGNSQLISKLHTDTYLANPLASTTPVHLLLSLSRNDSSSHFSSISENNEIDFKTEKCDISLSLKNILNTDDVFEPVLINFVIRQMINDPDPDYDLLNKELSGAMQIINILKLLIDPENMLSGTNKAEKSEFLSYFYRKSMCILINPLMLNTYGLKINREDYRIAQLQNLILDFLSFCVEHHTFHIKNYIINKDLLKHILVLLTSKHQFLALCDYFLILDIRTILKINQLTYFKKAALRFLRKTVSLKEETYNKHIIKSNLLEPVVEALKTNGSRYNLLNSAIIELFDFIRSDDIKSLMSYIVENFNSEIEKINYVRTFKDLKLRYEQHKEKLNDQLLSRSRLSSNDTVGGTPSIYRTRASNDRHRDRLDFDKEEDAWIEDDDEDIESRESNQNSISPIGILSSSLSSSSTSSSISNQSVSNNSNSNDEQVSNDHQIESFLEFKKSQNQLNIDENEDTLFSPAKSGSSLSSVSSTSSLSSSPKSISIKISSSTTLTLRNNKSPKNESTSQHDFESEKEQSNKNTINHHSNLSQSSNLISGKKHALVDYEDDSDDDENNISITFHGESSLIKNRIGSDMINETKEPSPKRAATDSNSILTKQAEQEAEHSFENDGLKNDLHQEEENKENKQILQSESPANNGLLINNNLEDKIDETNKVQNTCTSTDLILALGSPVRSIMTNETSDRNNNNLNDGNDNGEKSKNFDTVLSQNTSLIQSENNSQKQSTFQSNNNLDENSYHPNLNITNNLGINHLNNCNNNTSNHFNQLSQNQVVNKNQTSNMDLCSNQYFEEHEILDTHKPIKYQSQEEIVRETKNDIKIEGSSPPLSPKTLSSLEPANKRARLSNS